MLFSKAYEQWSFENNSAQTIHITEIESQGRDLEELLTNAVVYFASDRGEPCCENWTAGDLKKKDYDLLVSEFTEFINDYDPTPYCNWCGSMTMKRCKCGPRAEND